MAKPLFEDILPPERRSIRSIQRISSPERDRAEIESVREEIKADNDKIAEEKHILPKKKGYKGKIIAVIAIIVVLFVCAYFLMPRVSSARLTIIPKGEQIVVNSVFTANKSDTSDLPYQIVTYQKDGILTVPSTSNKHVEMKASGTIRIFNNFSSATQKLVVNTRFTTPQGLVYRISVPVVVPGKSGTVPGSVDVSAVADAPGDNYNLAFSDFSIPGFKGGPKYTAIFGRSVSAFSGGFSGDQAVVDPNQEATSRSIIDKELEASLVKQMSQNIPADYVFFPDAYKLDYQALPDIPADVGVKIAERATYQAIIFKQSDIVKALVKGTPQEKNDPDMISSGDSLTFALTQSSKNDPWNGDSFSFSLNGTTTLMNSIDVAKLKKDLAGLPRTNLNAILSSYPGVLTAQVAVTPFWKGIFPASPESISIDIGSTTITTE